MEKNNAVCGLPLTQNNLEFLEELKQTLIVKFKNNEILGFDTWRKKFLTIEDIYKIIAYDNSFESFLDNITGQRQYGVINRGEIYDTIFKDPEIDYYIAKIDTIIFDDEEVNKELKQMKDKYLAWHNEESDEFEYYSDFLEYFEKSKHYNTIFNAYLEAYKKQESDGEKLILVEEIINNKLKYKDKIIKFFKDTDKFYDDFIEIAYIVNSIDCVIKNNNLLADCSDDKFIISHLDILANFCGYKIKSIEFEKGL